jgi:D-glycero-beta-D-manno-heptose-7-phosphate kinase
MKIAVIGDVMLDKYDFCRNRDNPEGSAPCYTVEKTDYKPGGAGNVAANLVKLGSDTRLFSIVGDDFDSQRLVSVLDSLGIPHTLIKDANRPTIVKERTLSISDGRYHCRKDIEKRDYIQENHVTDIVSSLGDFGLIVVSDYNKGMISEKLMGELKKTGIPILVDPKPAHLNYYGGVFMIKPNSREAREMTGLENDVAAAEELRKELSTRVLLTRSENGSTFLDLDGTRLDVPTEAKKVFDITGAGDTVIATFAHFYSKKYSLEKCVKLANRAAGIAVAYPGCYQVSEAEVLR